ncbi:MAG: SURF1 family protein [Thiohalorhabdus sp.]|uniref:SURF1 family protein n=1 Tax=Thiohalorhabdus sp. TaxID=3094134 RepID=UPI00397EFD23
MRLGRLEFRPRPVPALATLVLLPILLALGVWQLDRAEQKRDLLASWETAKEGAPRPLSRAQEGKDSAGFSRVAAEGRYDGSRQFLLDNRIRDGRPGFQVLTPLRLEDREGAVLVNRGWVPMGKDRQPLRDLTVPQEPQRVQGLLADAPGVGLRLGPPDTGSGDWPRVVQYVAPERMADQLGYPVMGRVLQLGEGQPNGYRRDWEAPVSFGPQRHVGYAVQWFALAAALVTIFLVVNTKWSTSRDADPVANRDHPGA